MGKKKLFVILLLSLLIMPGTAMADRVSFEKHIDCLQMGYQTDYQYCLFPDNSKCLLTDFNAGTCGQEHWKTDYCVSRGQDIWDKDKCCFSLKPTETKPLMWGNINTTCESYIYDAIVGILNNWYVYTTLILVVLIGYFIYATRKRAKN